MRTPTGRWPYRGPEAQRLPLRTAEARRLLQAFRDHFGNPTAGMDFSAVEAAVLAHMTEKEPKNPVRRLREQWYPRDLTTDDFNKLEREWDQLKANGDHLAEAAEALGAMPKGYCFCSEHRSSARPRHEPECADLRAAIAAYRDLRAERKGK